MTSGAGNYIIAAKPRVQELEGHGAASQEHAVEALQAKASAEAGFDLAA